MPEDFDPLGDAILLAEAAHRMDAAMRSCDPNDWDSNTARGKAKAATARFRRDHPDPNSPWGYRPR